MGYHLTNAVWKSAMPARLKPLASLIAHTVIDPPKPGKAKHARSPLTFFAQVGTLARLMGRHDRQVRAWIRQLVEDAFLTLVAKGGGRRRGEKGVFGVSNTYEVHPDPIGLYAARESTARLVTARSEECEGTSLKAVRSPAGTSLRAVTNNAGNVTAGSEPIAAIEPVPGIELGVPAIEQGPKNVCKTARAAAPAAIRIPTFTDEFTFGAVA